MDYRYQHAVVAGTFDRFHAGHRKLLIAAFGDSQRVTIGIATDRLYANKVLSDSIESYTIREHAVSEFLSKHDFSKRSLLIPIHDIYGNTLSDGEIDAVFVTENTLANAQKVNEARLKKNMKPLAIITIPYVLDDTGLAISSERIRKGEIDRDGNSYARLFKEKKEYTLHESEKEAFRRPIGSIETDSEQVIRSLKPGTMLITVGDIVSIAALQAGRMSDISIIDYKTRRRDVEPGHFAPFEKIHKRRVLNPPGSITYEAVTKIREAISDFETTHAEQLIVVSGEEDLLAIPAILFSPLNTVVLYGQFDKGIVVVTISEQNKKHVQNLFRKFQ